MWLVYIGSMANVPEVYWNSVEAYERRDKVKESDPTTPVWVFKEG